MIDDEIAIGKVGWLTAMKTKEQIDEELKTTTLDKIQPLIIPVEVTKVIHESDGWVKEIMVRREDNPDAMSLLCIRFDDKTWISEDGCVTLD